MKTDTQTQPDIFTVEAGVKPRHEKVIRRAWNSIHPSLRELLIVTGLRFEVRTETEITLRDDIDPYFVKRLIAGEDVDFFGGSMWKLGSFSFDDNKLTVFTLPVLKYFDPVTGCWLVTKKEVGNEELHRAVIHELGHAVDIALMVSVSPSFMRLYSNAFDNKALEQLHKAVGKSLQDGKDAYLIDIQEIFANVWAGTPPYASTTLEEAYPATVIEWVHRNIPQAETGLVGPRGATIRDCEGPFGRLLKKLIGEVPRNHLQKVIQENLTGLCQKLDDIQLLYSILPPDMKARAKIVGAPCVCFGIFHINSLPVFLSSIAVGWCMAKAYSYNEVSRAYEMSHPDEARRNLIQTIERKWRPTDAQSQPTT